MIWAKFTLHVCESRTSFCIKKKSRTRRRKWKKTKINKALASCKDIMSSTDMLVNMIRAKPVNPYCFFSFRQTSSFEL